MRGLNLFILIAACSWWLLLVGCSNPTAAGPTNTPVVSSTAIPTLVPTSTQVPTPTLALADLFNVPAERVIAVGDMQGMRGHRGAFWRDKDPIVLRGCATGVFYDFDSLRWAIFSQDGGFSEDHHFVMVSGYRQVVEGACYEMVAAKFWDSAQCYSNSFLRPSLFGCETGWVQTTDLFLVVETGPGPAIIEVR